MGRRSMGMENARAPLRDLRGEFIAVFELSRSDVI